MLTCKVDYLQVGWHSRVAPERLLVLRSQRDLAATGPAALVEIAGRTWRVLPHGRGKNYPLALECEDAELSVSDQRGDHPAVMCRAKNATLYALGFAGSWALLETFAHALHEPHPDEDAEALPRSTLSRIDLAVDVQGIPFETGSHHEFTTFARQGERFSVSEYYEGRHVSGFRLGGGQKLLRIYDKTRELAARDETKGYIRDAWRQEAGDRFDEAGEKQSHVWRVEAQFRRDALRTLRPRDGGESWDVDTRAGIEAAMGSLWAYMTQSWANWRHRSVTEGNASKWTIREEWRVLASASWGSANVENDLAKKQERAATWERLIPGLAGYMTTAAALKGLESLEEAAGTIVEHVMRYLTEQKGLRWEEAVRLKRVTRNQEGQPQLSPD